MRTSRIRPWTMLAAATALVGAALTSPAQAAGEPPVVLIVLENHSYGPNDPGVNGARTKYIVGNTADAPYINHTLIPSGTLFTDFTAKFHPSLPDYLEMMAGTNADCRTDSCPPDSIAADNLFQLMGRAGVSFASLIESMPADCSLTSAGPYLVRHNPEAYFTNVDAAASLPYGCPATDLTIAAATRPGTPLAWPDPLPAFTFVVPNACDDMHGSGAGGCPSKTDQIITAGDTWLQANVPALLNLDPQPVVILTWDEGASGDASGGGGHVPTIVVGPNVTAGATDATPYSHAGLLAGLEDHFGLSPLLADAAGATPVPIPMTP